MKVPLLDLKAQYAGLRAEIREAMDRVCDAQTFILGPDVEAFEKHTAAYLGVEHAVGVSSGTDALLAALMALEIGPGDAVLTTPYSFFATAGSIVRTGAVPVFVDIDPVTCNMDPVQTRGVLEKRLRQSGGPRPRVLMPVHLYGQVADMDPLMALAGEYGLKVIEDACQAIGAEYPSVRGSVRAGSIGDFGCFSFFPSKNLGGFGDGGLVTSRDASLAAGLVKLRNHGMAPKYYHARVGGNFRLDTLQAVVLDIKLRHLDAWHQARRDHAAFYNARFAGTPVVTPAAVYEGRGLGQAHIYNQYVVRVPNRDALLKHLQQAGVGCEIYYPVPLHMQECFRSLGYRAGDFPESERAARETLALPVYPELTEEQQAFVVEQVLEGLKQGG